MQWLKPGLRNSIYGLLGHPGPPSDSVMDSAIEDIRENMLDLLGPDGIRNHPQVTRRIRYAGDVQALWYVRGELMAVLADMHGEATARTLVKKVSDRFRGVLPPSLAPRRRSLLG
jgi:hypothetical protein